MGEEGEGLTRTEAEMWGARLRRRMEALGCTQSPRSVTFSVRPRDIGPLSACKHLGPLLQVSQPEEAAGGTDDRKAEECEWGREEEGVGNGGLLQEGSGGKPGKFQHSRALYDTREGQSGKLGPSGFREV